MAECAVDSQAIANQTWQMLQEADVALNQSNQAQKQSQTVNPQSNHVVNLQALEKDVILPADPHGRQTAKLTQQVTEPSSKPNLPYPNYNSKVFSGTGVGGGIGLIALIGQVLCQQAKSNQNFWSNLWQQASQSMQMQVQFAPIVGDAIRCQYNAQSAATQSQATQSETDAFISFGMFGVSMLAAGAMEFSSPAEEVAPNNPASEFGEDTEETGESEGSGEAEGGADTEATETNQLDSEEDQLVNNQEESFSSRAMNTAKNIWSKISPAQSRLTSYMTRLGAMGQTFSMLAQGATHMNDAKYQSQQAADQAVQGQANATTQMSEMYAQFYGQDFARMEDLRQGASQNLDYAMNILQQAANSITQTVTSMFRG